MTIVLQFFPNGEFTQGVDTSKRRDKHAPKNRRHDSLTQECRDGYLRWSGTDSNADIHLCTPGQQFEDLEGGIYTYLCEDHKGHHYAYERGERVEADVLLDVPIGRLVALGTLVPLVHQLVESSPIPQKPSRKRLLGMTKNMARNIRNGVYLLEQKYTKDNLSFLTLTLPDLNTDDLIACCERWDYMTDQLLKWVRKQTEKFGIQFEYVYCTEIQCKRLQQKKEYAPHLHIVFRGRSGRKGAWCVTPQRVRKAWASIIACVIGHRTFVTAALENLQRIKYSAARYLSKYLSKGKSCSSYESGVLGDRGSLHTQWGGMARTISRAIKSCTQVIRGDGSNGELGVLFLRQMGELIDSGYIRYFSEGFILLSRCPSTGVERGIKVGSGALRRPTFDGGLSDAISYLLTLETL